MSLVYIEQEWVMGHAKLMECTQVKGFEMKTQEQAGSVFLLRILLTERVALFI